MMEKSQLSKGNKGKIRISTRNKMKKEPMKGIPFYTVAITTRKVSSSDGHEPQ